MRTSAALASFAVGCEAGVAITLAESSPQAIGMQFHFGTIQPCRLFEPGIKDMQPVSCHRAIPGCLAIMCAPKIPKKVAKPQESVALVAICDARNTDAARSLLQPALQGAPPNLLVAKQLVRKSLP